MNEWNNVLIWKSGVGLDLKPVDLSFCFTSTLLQMKTFSSCFIPFLIHHQISSDLLECALNIHLHHSIPDLNCQAPWCVSAPSVFAVLAGSSAKSQAEDNHKTYLSHAASGWAIWLLVYLLWHTPSHWESVAPHPPPPHSCWLLARSPLASLSHPCLDASRPYHGGDNSHTPVSVFFVLTFSFLSAQNTTQVQPTGLLSYPAFPSHRVYPFRPLWCMIIGKNNRST